MLLNHYINDIQLKFTGSFSKRQHNMNPIELFHQG